MNDVSRETVAADAAAAVFSTRLPLARDYAELLAAEGVTRGLIGPREVPRLWDRHLLNCAVVAELIPADADVIDVGSGAGLPGLVLAIARPDVWMTLVEPMARRTSFLDTAVAELKLDNVEVLRARAEEVEPRGKADVVTSRAVAPLGRLTEWSMPLARPLGRVLAIKGASAETELAKYAKEIRKRGAATAEVLRCGTATLETPTTVVSMTRRG